MTEHTAALDHALAEALRHSLATHADSIHIEVMVRHDNGTPARFRVSAWHGANYWSAENADPLKALTIAMRKLRGATNSLRPVPLGGAS